jgi:hypothetical protein
MKLVSDHMMKAINGHQDKPGESLYLAYSQHFCYRHPLPWGALRVYERALWAAVEYDTWKGRR